MNEISFVLGSVTKAAKAKRILKAAGISATQIKTTSQPLGECMHGVKISAEDMYDAALALRSSGIEYTVEK